MAVKRIPARTTSIPAPTGGWNARDALGSMPLTDAVHMVNFFPTTSDVVLRKGYTRHMGALTGNVQTLMTYSPGVATSEKLFAITDAGNVYLAPGTTSLTGLANGKFQYVNITTAGGSYLLMVNGSNYLHYYDGTTWTYDTAGTFSVTGMDTRTCVYINLFKNRVWLVQKDTLKVWYLPTSSIAGVAQVLDFNSVARRGGYLVTMENWTIDAGEGADDHAVFITSNGEVIVYKGTDPASASTWALVGVWQLGAPIGRRCSLKWAGDCLVLSQDGILPMAGALQTSRLDPGIAFTDKIRSAVSEAATNYGSLFGWQMIHFPKLNMLILNVPILENNTSHQYVMNTITKSWCRWEGINANCWVLFQGDLYFGGKSPSNESIIGKAWEGYSDNSTNAIVADVKQAFNYFKAPGLTKRWTMIRPIFRSDGLPGFISGLNVDFDDVDVTGSMSYNTNSLPKWDSSIWDDSYWPAGMQVLKYWQGVSGTGFCAALRMKLTAKDMEVHWLSTDHVYEVGGVL